MPISLSPLLLLVVIALDPENPVVKNCAAGIMLEGEGQHEQALALYKEAWKMASSKVEKSIASHYLARQQSSIAKRLEWNKKALKFALETAGNHFDEMLPSLYLNLGKDFEDLNQADKAKTYYETALRHSEELEDNGYGKLIRGGILNGIKRIEQLEK